MDPDAPNLLFDQLPIGAYRSTPDGRQLRANAALVRLNGYGSEAEMLLATQALDVGWYVEPERREVFKDLMKRDGQVAGFVSQVHRHKTREIIWIRECAYAVRDDSGQVLYYEGTVEDITEVHQVEQSLVQSEARWRLALDASGDGVWDWHVHSGQEYCTDSLKAMLGYASHELADDDTALNALTHPDDWPQMQRDIAAHLTGDTAAYRNEHRALCKNGEWKWVLSRGMVVERDAQGQPARMTGTLTDISLQKQAEALVFQQAHFDPLTGLPNRRMLKTRGLTALARARQHGLPVLVGMLDLDHFKQINDTLGHDSGDELLMQVATRLQQQVGPANTVARMGGDEFALVITDALVGPDGAFDAVASQAKPRLTALLHAISQPYVLRGQRVYVSASVGLAVYPVDGASMGELQRHADQALYAAKAAGRNRARFFSAGMQAAAQSRARLDRDLHTALSAGQLHLVYQPIVDLRTRRVVKAEALLRWQHPELGPVGPDEFIPVAEASGLVVPIGDWVFEQAARQAQLWRTTLEPDFQISINRSPVQCHHAMTADTSCLDHLAAMGVPPEAVAIEITESVLLDTGPDVIGHMNALQAAGVQLSLDDFGTGFSSLTYLQRLHIDTLKIDRSFVSALSDSDSTALSLCKAVIAMATELGMTVVAEGVETAQQHHILALAGCHQGQGYWYARPMPAAELEAWVRQQQTGLAGLRVH
jgi:diguanylate cyclase (GGDEF)-like protein/PAS domain S-box-containing protein